MRTTIYYLRHFAVLFWIFRGRPEARLSAMHGLWLDYRGERRRTLRVTSP